MTEYVVTPKMEAYAKSGKGKDKDPMKCLFESDDLFDISLLVVRLVFVSVMQGVKCIVPEDKEQVDLAGDMSRADRLCCGYAAFVCRFNPNFSDESFDKVSALCMERYRGYWGSTMDEFANLREDWMRGFEEALIL